ncbi:hypothetical protein Cni_G07578 [Canna indica]|uniref:B-block binding subunit of TFIIIC domain-containing protein n=1 Tax=Canna indica TaxID=4628 RepID=A0AAQ3JYY2_9LILI|nr:hypothetical protein Cni_G07578 [Canna indica]
MDSIISAAIEEICGKAAGGILLSDLWPSLRGSLSGAGLPTGDAVNKAIWARLLAHPGLRFEAHGSPLVSQDPSIQSMEEAERIGVKIVAGEHLRDCFLGIYDLKASASEISQIQRAALERLAASRTNGVTQSELGKEFGIKGNSFFYIVRNLESQQLIVRQPTILRAKESGADGENAQENSSVVSTNLLHLYRYAKNLNLNPQQRFEITRADILDGMGHVDESSSNVVEISGDFTKGDVSVKDYLPAMKAICDKLEEACGKVLVVSDIKTSLGYKKSTGHRAWRNILQRLKDANLVEEFQAEVNKRVVICLRLLKKFDPSDFQPKKGMHSHDSFENENSTKIGKRGHVTNHLVELPLEHCIYDMVDAEGQKGLTIPEVSRRLGFTTKKLYKRISTMRERFRMRWQAELHDRTPVYRVWTFENYPHHSSDALRGKQEALPYKNDLLFQSKNLTSPSCQLINLCSTSDPLPLEKKEFGSVGLGVVPSTISPRSDQVTQKIKCSVDQQNDINGLSIVPYNKKPESMETALEMNVQQLKGGQLVSSTSFGVKAARQRSISTLNSTRREEWIVKKLKKERFVLTVELHKWLEELEKGKHTKMCRKTLIHILNKLQKEGLCKCIQVSIPVLTNYNRHRITDVILHPSVENLSPELLEKIYRKQRDFDVRIRVQASAKSRNCHPVHKLTSLSIPRKNVEDRNALIESMRANGFVSARMVRAKLLHKFLWSYVSNSPNWNDTVDCSPCGYGLKSTQSTCHLFALDEAIKRMPLELFLQVVGSPKEIENMVERCKLGLRLSDIPLSEYKSLLDCGATFRLSCIINILVRMKLMQLVKEGVIEDDNGLPHAVLTYAMELKPYIEEPMIQTPVTSHVRVDLRPRIRHDFVLLKPEAVDVYWETLEYCYAAANKQAASHAFPGSSAQEVFQIRSWTSLRVMTAEQRSELLEHVNNVDPKKKISFKDCIRIARELNLTVEQVLRVSYDRRQSRLSSYSRILKYKQHENRIGGDNSESFYRKRKRSFIDGSTNPAFEENGPIGASKEKIYLTPGVDAQSTGRSSCSPVINKSCLSACRDHNNVKHAVDLEDGRNHAFIRCAFPRQPMRAKRFSWTDSLDRQLVMQYARQRAILGARFYRVDWSSLSDLPALPGTCRRRMTVLISNSNVRRAVMRLCNLLGERYARYLEKTRMMKEKESHPQNLTLNHESVSEANFQHCFWDNFEDPDIKIAVDEIIRYKRLTKFQYVKTQGSKHGKEMPDFPPTSVPNLDIHESSQPAFKEKNVVSECDGSETQKLIPRCKKVNIISTSANRSSSHHSHRNLMKILNSRYTIMKKKVCESLAVANAVELLKLVFLSTSTSPEVQSSLVAILQLYSENDIFTAFNYLKEMNFMVVGHGSRPFVLSKKFWHHASSSPFPIDSGKRADEFSSWLSKQEKHLMEDGVSLTRDLQCGEICHLFALVSSGEFTISPCLPKEGIGEADEVEHDKVSDSNNLKRKSSEFELNNFKKVKKPRIEMKMDNDYCSRREKGFPGIRVVLNRKIISQADTFWIPREQESLKCHLWDDNSQGLSHKTVGSTLLSNLMYQNFRSSTSVSENLPWDAMISYAQCLSAVYMGRNKASNFSHELFKSVHSAVFQAGELGLAMNEISQAVDPHGHQLTEVIVDTLEAFQSVIKVNSYDDIRVLDSSHKYKYFIQSPGVHAPQMPIYKHAQVMSYGASQQTFEKKTNISYQFGESSRNFCDGHKVTIFDLPSETIILDVEGQESNSGKALPEESMEVVDSNQGKDAEERNCTTVSDGHKVTILDLPTDTTMLDVEGQDSKSGAALPEERMVVAESDQGKDGQERNSATVSETHVCCPILPWVNGDGSTNTIVYKGLTRRLLGTVMQNPGILEEDIIWRMDVLNPQSCRRLIELMILENHLTVRMLSQTPSSAPVMLQKHFGSCLSNAKPIFRKHFFANPRSGTLL